MPKENCVELLLKEWVSKYREMDEFFGELKICSEQVEEEMAKEMKKLPDYPAKHFYRVVMSNYDNMKYCIHSLGKTFFNIMSIDKRKYQKMLTEIVKDIERWKI